MCAEGKTDINAEAAVFPDIEELIPHRGRMKLIDGILEISDSGAVTTARVSDQWPLYADSSVDALALIEIVAQTAAVHISGRSQGGRSASDRRGWMVGIKNASFCQERIPVNVLLRTTIKLLYSMGDYAVMHGEVFSGSDLLCTADVQVLRERNEAVI